MMRAPVVVFAYNRIDHLKKTIEALRENEFAGETALYVFSDGSKNTEDRKQVDLVRTYLKNITGFKSVEIFEQKENLGLANSIISGVTKILKDHEAAIVLEDDLVTSKYFLRYMNEALEFYKEKKNVASIHGYCYPINERELPEFFFLKGADCWGWATWRRAWNIFEADGKKLLQELKDKNLNSEFDFNNSYPYTKMLENQTLNKNNSWAIRWYASAFLNNMLTLYPRQSYVLNIGHDGSGAHFDNTSTFQVDLSQTVACFQNTPVEHSKIAFTAFENYFKKHFNLSLVARVKKKVQTFLKR